MLVANGAGLALAVGVLPIAAAGRGGFAAAYLLQLLALPLILHAGRRLAESPRYLVHARERHRYRELLVAPYRRRMVAVGASALLSAIFFAPSAEFYNRYLENVHGFSAFEIVAFLAVTGAPSFAMLPLGGRLADLRGRKAIGLPLLAGATIAIAAFFVTSGPWLWLSAFAGSMLGSAGGAALAPYRSELFPTRVRSGANTLVLVAAVAGSAVGLLGVGLLAGSAGLGTAIAVLGVFPLCAGAIVLLAFPETARRELEDTSAEGSAAGRLA